MTKQNPRPRKYASDAERQAAYRSRAAEVCVRLEPKTMATLDSIADEIGYTRNELMQSMVKFGLTNRDWRNEGLTAHKRLPRYQENPMATKPPSAAQLAARARFAEMARSGVLNRKRQIAAKQNASVKRKANPTPVVVETLLKQLGGNKFMVMTGSKVFDYGSNMLTLKLPTNKSKANYLDIVYHPGKDLYTMTFRRVFNRGLDSKRLVEYDDLYADQLREVFTLATGMETSLGTLGRRTNPAKKTVSQKISQLVHEGYPQRQAVAVALNEQRAGKVKRNPRAKSVKSSSTANFAYCVEAKRSLGSAGSVFEMVAGFNTKAQAQDYINAILTSHPGVTLRIKAYK